MSEALQEALIKFDVDVDEKPLEEFGQHLEKIKQHVERIGERLAEYFAFRELKEFVVGTIEMGAQLDDMSVRLGLTTDELQKFQFAASLGGVGAEEAAHSLGLFTRQLGEASSGGGEAAKTLAALGVHFKDAGGKVRPTLDILDDVAEKMQGL